MPANDKRVDAYIARSADFARPVLKHLRTLVHRACPGAIETIKWGFPHFEHHGILCSMASFRGHCAFGFWKAKLIDDPDGVFSSSGEAMGSLGRITGVKDLPSDAALLRLIRHAARLNEEGVGIPRPARKKAAPPPPVPAPFRKALREHPRAAATFRGLPPSHRKDYIEWIAGAKLPETREKRIATSIDWLSQGKSRNWKYERSKKGVKS